MAYGVVLADGATDRGGHDELGPGPDDGEEAQGQGSMAKGARATGQEKALARNHQLPRPLRQALIMSCNVCAICTSRRADCNASSAVCRVNRSQGSV